MSSYERDERIPCRYADKCYQKNSEHHKKYKHPPKNNKRKHIQRFLQTKKLKITDENESSTSDSKINVEQKNELNSSSNSEEPVTNQNKIENIVPDEKPKAKVEPNTENCIKLDDLSDREFIKTAFLLNLPEDFYKFWEFCQFLNRAYPSDALKDVGLKLVGPYDVLAGKLKESKIPIEKYLLHWRYFYDTPEVLTVLKGDDKTGFHIGYFFDSPDLDPVFVVGNHGLTDGTFKKMGDNIFAAVNTYLEEMKKNCDPFKKIKIGKLQSSIKTKAEQLNISVTVHSKKMRERELKVVTKTYNKIGLVVPYNRKTQLGYRELAMEDKDLITLLNKLEKAIPEQRPKYLSDLQPVLTYANIALDECDFGTGVKLGWELLYHGVECLNGTIAQFLANSYRLLNKEAFAKIAEIHMKNRKKGCDLSVV